MTHPTQSDRDDASTPPDRETVARVIDPKTWAHVDARAMKYADPKWLQDYLERSKAAGARPLSMPEIRERFLSPSLAKADAIIALWPTGEGVSGGVVEALTHAISICPSLDTNGYITEKSEAIKAVKAALRLHAAPPSSGGEG